MSLFILFSSTFLALAAIEGSATILPPRTVPPNKMPALIITMSLIMYCPARVGTMGIILNTSEGKINMGEKAPINCKSKSAKVTFNSLPVNKPIPMRHSSVASATGKDFSEKILKVKTFIVRIDKSSIGLTPGKYLRNPNHKKMSPKLMRNNAIP